MTLEERLQELARNFASNLVEAIKNANKADLTPIKPKVKRARRTKPRIRIAVPPIQIRVRIEDEEEASEEMTTTNRMVVHA